MNIAAAIILIVVSNLVGLVFGVIAGYMSKQSDDIKALRQKIDWMALDQADKSRHA